MPKKTKKEKILAEYRRKLKQLQLDQKNVTAPVSNKILFPKKEIVPAPTILSKPVGYQESDYDRLLAQFTIQDLKKTFFVSFFILVLEFLIFFVNLRK